MNILRKFAFSAATAAALAGVQEARARDASSPAAPGVDLTARRADGKALGAPRAGDSLMFEATLSIREAGTRLTGATLTLEGPLRPLPPARDGVDNDGLNGADDPAEAKLFELSPEGLLLWRPDPKAAPLAAGEKRRLRFRADVAPDARPDAQARARLTADSGESALAFSLEPLHLALERSLPPGVTLPLAHREAMGLTLRAEFPPGAAQGADMTLVLPAAAEIAETPRTTLGEGVSCRDAKAPQIREGAIYWALGDCVTRPDAPAAKRSAEISARLRLRDADPLGGEQDAKAHRTGVFYGMMREGGALAASAESPAPLWGPLIGGLLVKAPEAAAYEAGQKLEAVYELRNIGDAPAQDLTIWPRLDGPLECDATQAAIDGGPAPRPLVRPRADVAQICGLGVIPEGGILAPGARLTLRLTTRVRPDAPLDAPISLGLDAAARAPNGKAPRIRIQSTSLAPRPPGAPGVALDEEAGGWRGGGDEIYARPGEAARFGFAFVPARGVSRPFVVLRARLVTEDPETGEARSAGAAPLRLTAVAPDEKTRPSLLEGPPEKLPPPETADGWTILRAPLGRLKTDAAAEGEPAPAAFLLDVMLDPEDETLKSGHMLDIESAVENAGARVGAQSALRVIVQEPSLTLTAVSSDADRMLRPGESAPVSADVCNLGDGAADGVVLEAQLSDGWSPDSIAEARVSRTGPDWPSLENAPSAPANATYDVRARVLRLAADEAWAGDLEAGGCLRLAFTLKASGDAAFLAPREALFRLGSYAAGREASARRYRPPAEALLSFGAVALEVGPSQEGWFDPGAKAVYEGAVRAPVVGGPYDIEWRLDSSQKLPWTLRGGPKDPAPWPNRFTLKAGESRSFRLEAPTPKTPDAAWTDTLVLRVAARPASSDGAAAILAGVGRWVTRLGKDLDAFKALAPVKTMALDRDCDGDLENEAAQDARFENHKEPREGECVVFRVRFRNGGKQPLDDVEIRDTPPAQVVYVPGSATVGETSNGFLIEGVDAPSTPGGAIVWRFKGVFHPGDEGEAIYRAKVKGGS